MMDQKVYNKKYRKIKELGQGAYGKINLAERLGVDTTTGEDPHERYVALKKLLVDVRRVDQQHSGIDFTSIREIKILKAIDHPNIVKLKDVFVENDNIYLAMECLVCDLAKLIDDEKVTFTEEDISDIFRQVLLGVNHLHKNWILHRVD